ncbi:DNA alkylation repair protein [Streptococcus massiliensis]|uniref:DNA alkylation repair protein n=1 Tax=Streptococcus massiliensis TaxID=313439 RepID=A0A380KXM4_9STRE|nr:DNA alkylation repair protein [Streptococcus massiliensis]SUN75894.1 DNA alkylation repair protein [Streptococcus massiliensis]
MMIDEILKELAAVADEADAVKMRSYMKNQFDYLGVRTPVRRQVAKKCFKKIAKTEIDWVFIKQAWDNSYRELQYVALDYLQSKKNLLTPADLPKLKNLAQSKSWWDTIDNLDRLVGDLVFRFPECKATILAWSVDSDFWLRRLAIDHQLLRKEETDTALLEQILLNNLGQTEFFINKAIGWSLRDYSKTNPQWVAEFIDKNRDEMATLSIREGSKYL